MPLVIGIVGRRHYDPGAKPHLEAALRKIYTDLAEAHPCTPLLILSSLAQGADQLAAEVAFAMRDSPQKLPVTVRSPLPFPLQKYFASTTFDVSPEGAQARERAKRWIEDGEVTCFVVPHPGGPPVDRPEEWHILGEGPAEHFRRVCYANAGAYIVRRCQVLIALWEDSGGDLPAQGEPSGTWETVRFQLYGTPPALDPSDLPMTSEDAPGPVFGVYTPLAGASDGARAGEVTVRVPGGGIVPGEVLGQTLPPRRRFLQRLRKALGTTSTAHHLNLLPEESIAAEWQQFLGTGLLINDYNRDVSEQWDLLEEVATTALENFLGRANVDYAPSPGLERTIRLRAVAGHLARSLHARLNVAEIVLFVAIGLGAVFFHLYAHHFEIAEGGTRHEVVWLMASLSTVVVSFGTVFWVWYHRLDERRLDYRALAEALRVRAWWAVAGIGVSVADNYLNQLRSEMAWARKSVYALSLPPTIWSTLFANLPSDRERYARLAFVWRNWIKEQTVYYSDRVGEHHRLAVALRQAGLGSALAAWLLAFGIALFSRAHPPHELLLLSGILLVGGGLTLAFCERKSYEDLANQFDRSAAVLRKADEELGRCLGKGATQATPADLKRAQAILEIVGREAIVEHAQWLILRRSRPFEVPIA